MLKINSICDESTVGNERALQLLTAVTVAVRVISSSSPNRACVSTCVFFCS